MDKKVTGIVGYLTWIGWIIAYCAGDKEGAKFHLNQSLVLWLAMLILAVIARIVGWIPIIGWIVAFLVGICMIALLVFVIIGLVNACKEDETPLPLFGGIKLLK